MLKQDTFSFELDTIFPFTNIPAGYSDSFPSTSLTQFDSEDVVIKATLNLMCSSCTSNGTQIGQPCAELYYKETSNGPLELVDRGESITGGLSFNVSKLFFLNRYVSGYIVIKNISQSYFLKIPKSGHTLTADYYERGTIYQSECVVSSDINENISYLYDSVIHRFVLKKQIYDGLLKEKISLVFNPNRSSDMVFPDGWRLNIIEKLSIQRTGPFDSGDVVSIAYIDEDGVRHNFDLVDNSSDLYYSVDGTRLIIHHIDDQFGRPNHINFELYSEYSPGRKCFNRSGEIIRVEDGDGNYYTVYSTGIDYTITDSSSNVITINKDSTTGIVSIKLNNSFEYLLNVASSKLTSIEYNNKEDLISYDTNGNLLCYEADDGYSTEFTYSNNKIINAKHKHNGNILENDSFEYDYLKTITTNSRNVKTYCVLNEELSVIGSGEIIDQEENQFFIHSKKLLNSDLVASITKDGSQRVYLNSNNNPSFYFSNSSGTYSTSNCAYTDANNELSIVAGNRYLLFATLEKTHNYPLNENRTISLKLVNNNNIEIASLNFNSIYEKQNVVADFVASYSDSPNNEFQIKIEYSGLDLIKPFRIKNIYITEFKSGKRDTYFSTKPSNDFITDTNTPITINGIDWYEFETGVDTNSTYSYEDLVRNFINVSKNTHLIWSEDGHHLSYNEDVDLNNNPFTYYLLRGHTNTKSANAMFAKKTWVKDYYEGNTKKEIFEFSYLVEDNNVIKNVNIKFVGNQSFKTIKTFDDVFNVVSETNDNDDYTNKTYSTNTRKLLSVVSGNDNTTETFSKTYSYDSKGRITSISTNENNATTSIGYSYVSNYEIVSYITDERLDNEQYTYDSFYEEITEIDKGSVSLERVFTNSKLVFSNDSDFQYEFISVNNNNNHLEKTIFGIKDEVINSEDIYLDLVTYTQECETDDEYSYKQYADGYTLKYENDKYSHLLKVLETSDGISYNVIAAYYYFEPRTGITNIVPYYNESSFETYIDGQDFANGLNAKLYKVFDYQAGQVIDYYFNEDGVQYRTDTKHLDQNGNLLSTTYVVNHYDKLNRITSIDYYYAGGSYTKTITYAGTFDNSITNISYSNNNFSSAQLITYDDLKRISSISVGMKKIEFNYSSLSTGVPHAYINPYYEPIVSHGMTYFKKNNFGLDIFEVSKLISYDAKGNIVEYGDGLNGHMNTSTMSTYSYDINDRLIAENNIDLSKNISYQYDDNGNILSATYRNIGSSTIVSVDTYVYGSNTEYKDLLTSFNGNNICYDDNLNIISIGNNIELTWARGHQLTSYIKDNIETSFAYNRDGIRISKNGLLGTHKYFLDGSDIYAETITNNNVTSSIIYLYGLDGVFGFVYNNVVYTYKKNVFGDVIAICYGANEIAQYKYDAYGNHKVYDSSGIEIDETYTNYDTNPGYVNPIRYRGYYFDVETGLYYCKNRYYSSKLRRWISIDEDEYFDGNTLLATNLFAYCLNNPIKYTDPEGKSILAFIIMTIMLMIIGSVVAGTITQIGISYTSYFCALIASIWDDDIRSDLNRIGWNPFNANDYLATHFSKISFYKGVPVFKSPFKRSGTLLGMIFFNENDNENDKSNFDIIKHEYGHAIQEIIQGPINYFLFSFIPSWGQFGVKGDNYYYKPWEAFANFVTGCNPNNDNYDIGDYIFASLHLVSSIVAGPFSYLFSFWK